jgi:hypothetical protein
MSKRARPAAGPRGTNPPVAPLSVLRVPRETSTPYRSTWNTPLRTIEAFVVQFADLEGKNIQSGVVGGRDADSSDFLLAH